MFQKLIIMDLDDTLVQTSKIIRGSYLKARQYLSDSGAKVETLEKLDEIYDSPLSFHKAVKKMQNDFIRDSLSEEELYKSIDIYNKDQNNPNIELYPGSLETLSEVQKLRDSGQVKAVLLTSSRNREVQQAKIDKFSLSKYFDDIHIDDFHEDRTKGQAMIEYMQRMELDPQDVIVVGDKLSDEIKQGNIYSVNTVWVKQGRHGSATPRDDEKPTYEIDKIEELPDLLKKLE